MVKTRTGLVTLCRCGLWPWSRRLRAQAESAVGYPHQLTFKVSLKATSFVGNLALNKPAYREGIPKHWRDRAEQTLSKAQQEPRPEARDRLRKVAREYEQLAQRAEQCRSSNAEQSSAGRHIRQLSVPRLNHPDHRRSARRSDRAMG